MNTSLASRFARCLGHNLLAVLVLAVVAVGSLAMAPKESVHRPDVTENAQTLAERFACHPNVENPTHVLVTTEDGVLRYGGQRLTDKAVEQVEFGVDHGMTVHTFCP